MSALLVTLLAAGLAAQAPEERPRPPSTETRKAAARKAYAKGQRLYDKGRYRAALAALGRALDHWPYREIHFNMALCYHELKNAVRAYRHLQRYLKGASDKERKSVPRSLGRLRRKVGVVVVYSSDDTAEIWIGGRRLGRGRVERVVAPGRVAVEIRQGDRMVKSRVLRVPRGGTATWDVTLGKIITVGPPKVRRRRRRLLHWRYVVSAAGLAVAATITAIGLGVKTRDLHSEFDRNPTWPTRDQGLRYQALTNLMWGVAGAAVVGAAVLTIFTRWRRREKPSARRIVPVVTPGGVAVTGTW